MNEDYTKFAEEECTESENKTAKKQKGYIGTVVNCSSLNVRSEPNKEASILCTIPCGAKVLLTKRQAVKGFYAVCTEAGMEGYCVWSYISINSEE